MTRRQMLTDLAYAYALELTALVLLRALLGRAWVLTALVLAPPAVLGWARWWPRRARSKVRTSGRDPFARRRVRKAGERWVAWWPTKLPGSRIIDMTPDARGGWTGTVELPDGDTMASIEPQIASLESTLQLRPDAIAVEQDPGNRRRVRVRVQVGDPITAPVPWPGAPPDATVLRPATIGQYLDADALTVPLRGECILVAGRRGAGKSGVLNALLGYLSACPDAALVGIDLKGGLELKPWARVFTPHAIARTLPDALRLLRALHVLMGERMDEMSGLDRDWPYSASRPAVVLVIDEQSLVKNDKEAIRLLEELVVLGRALGIVVIMATQYPTKGATGSPALVEQITVTIGLRVRSATASRVLFGESADAEGWRPHEIPADAKGTLYLEGPGADRPRLARAWYVTDDKVKETVARYADRRPDLRLRLDAARPEVDRVRAMGPAGSAPRNDTNPDTRDGSGGGEAAPILEVLRTAGADGLTTGQLLALVEAPRSTLHYQLGKLRDAGQVEQPERGLWRVVQ